MRSKVTTSDKSIDNAGIPSDYRLAIAEYIWNSFDAKASNVDIQFEANELGHISYFVISDNGEGINLSTIASTFGAFLDSQKQQSYQRTSDVRGKKKKKDVFLLLIFVPKLFGKHDIKRKMIQFSNMK